MVGGPRGWRGRPGAPPPWSGSRAAMPPLTTSTALILRGGRGPRPPLLSLTYKVAPGGVACQTGHLHYFTKNYTIIHLLNCVVMCTVRCGTPRCGVVWCGLSRVCLPASPCLSVSVSLPLQPVCLGEATGWPGCGGGEGGGVCLRPHGVTLAPTAATTTTTTAVPVTTCASLTSTSTSSLAECMRVCR